MRGAQFGKLLVLYLDDLGGGVAVLAVPERIDRQHLHVDRHGIHGFETLLDDDELLLVALDQGRRDGWLAAHQRDRFLEAAMGVHVDGLDPLAVDRYRQARPLLGTRCVEEPTTAKRQTR